MKSKSRGTSPGDHSSLGKVNLELTNMATNIKNIENNIANISLKIKNIETYNRLKPIYDAWQMAKYKESFYKDYIYTSNDIS